MLTEKEINYFRAEISENKMVIISIEDINTLMNEAFELGQNSTEKELKEHKYQKIKEMMKWQK